MKFQVITLFPQLIESFRSEGVIGQARSRSLLSIETINPREFTKDVHKTVDDRPYGGGDGMIMLAEPLAQAIGKASGAEAGGAEDPWVVYLSPQGSLFHQSKARELSLKKNLVLVCGRYGGTDQRFLNEFVDEEISIGDYVLSGGELAACVVMDAVSRQLPGVLGHADSANRDSFSDKLEGLLEAPSYTRPRDWLGDAVPEILLGGHHAKIEVWRRKVSVLVTLMKRPDLLVEKSWSRKEAEELKRFWKELPISEKEVLGLSTLTDQDLELLGNEHIDLGQ